LIQKRKETLQLLQQKKKNLLQKLLVKVQKEVLLPKKSKLKQTELRERLKKPKEKGLKN
jgi:hypothetical protein